jgi:Tol biopolymer transport system component
MVFGLIISFLFLMGFACSKDESDTTNFSNSRVYNLHDKIGSTDPSWSPVGDEIVFCYEHDLWIISPSGGEPTQVTSMTGQEICPEWLPDPDQRKIVFINVAGPEEYSIYTLDLDHDELNNLLTLNQTITTTSWSRDGSRITYLIIGKAGIYAVSSEGGEPELIPSNEEWEQVRYAHCSPAHDYIVFTDHKQQAYRINTIPVVGGNVTTVATFQGTWENPSNVAESYDGLTIVFCDMTNIGASRQAGTTNLKRMPSTGGAIVVLTEYYYMSVTHFSWSPDNQRLVAQVNETLTGDIQKTLCIVELK